MIIHTDDEFSGPPGGANVLSPALKAALRAYDAECPAPAFEAEPDAFATRVVEAALRRTARIDRFLASDLAEGPLSLIRQYVADRFRGVRSAPDLRLDRLAEDASAEFFAPDELTNAQRRRFYFALAQAVCESWATFEPVVDSSPFAIRDEFVNDFSKVVAPNRPVTSLSSFLASLESRPASTHRLGGTERVGGDEQPVKPERDFADASRLLLQSDADVGERFFLWAFAGQSVSAVTGLFGQRVEDVECDLARAMSFVVGTMREDRRPTTAPSRGELASAMV